jgi:hypothetical protein
MLLKGNKYNAEESKTEEKLSASDDVVFRLC